MSIKYRLSQAYKLIKLLYAINEKRYYLTRPRLPN